MATRRSTGNPRTPWTKQAVVGVVVLFLLGGSCGAALTTLLPDGGVLADGRARHRLRLDTGRSLRAAAEIASDDVDLVGVAALSRLLLWLEHGADDGDRDWAIKRLEKATAAARTSPEALYARALLLTTMTGAADPRLVADLGAAGEDPWSLLARARLAELNTNDDDGAARALVLFERAAVTKDPLPHASHQLARAAARRGDFIFARAVLDRLFALAPQHAAGAVTAAILALAEEQAPAEQRRRSTRADDVDTKRLLALLDDRGLNDGDHHVVAVALAVTRHARADIAAPTWTPELLKATATSTLEHAVELALFVGDVDSAEAFVKRQPTVTTLSFVADIARTRFLRAVSEDERRAATTSERRVTAAAIELPLGRFVFDFSQPGLPLSAWPSPAFFPERRLLHLLVDLEAGGSRDRLEPRLVAIEKLGLADRAIARGDLAGAEALIGQARDLAGADADVSLTEATLRARQNDPVGVKSALGAAVTAAPLDPAVLLTAVRLGLDVGDLGIARRALTAFNRLGFRSAGGSAVTALLEARSGDLSAASKALADAKRLGGADDIAALRATILVYRASDVAEARTAADALLARAGTNDAADGDVVATWIAEAAFRQGDQPRAQAALKAVVDTRPQIAEAHLFYAQTIAFFPHLRSEALFEVGQAIKGLGTSALAAEAKKLLATLKAKK